MRVILENIYLFQKLQQKKHMKYIEKFLLNMQKPFFFQKGLSPLIQLSLSWLQSWFLKLKPFFSPTNQVTSSDKLYANIESFSTPSIKKTQQMYHHTNINKRTLGAGLNWTCHNLDLPPRGRGFRPASQPASRTHQTDTFISQHNSGTARHGTNE